MNSDPLIARLEAVDLREVWHHEAHHFTPWLLNNAEALAESLGMELELEQAEHPVGDFSLDLIGTDTAERIEPSASFEFFLERRESLEASYGGPLKFEALERRRASRIADYRPGSIEDTDAWPEFIDWFIDSQIRLRAAVEAVRGSSAPLGN